MAEFSINHIARHGFGGLFQTHGRDSRTQFWTFGALVFGPLIVIQFATQIVLTFPSLGDMAAASGSAGNREIFEAQMRGMITSAYVNIGLYLLGALLLLTAAVRRLHDRGRAGWWALILPLGLFATGLGQAERMAAAAKRMPAMLAEMERHPAPDPGAMFEWAVKANVPPGGSDWLAVAGGLLLLGLLIDLARAGTAGPNRFGAA
ncbi:uncharacterized membrane protein YhaH (DUF805 family) [Sphingopyxis sp. OAS728]|uniref:DUF805 domain-containing protein n=1 Tax=Sphingopyxis sp. OAS728 TaxID=2663823 RepID=UPI00178A42E9|nr:DUF805 domain-containing protein [Sphingopyxis sp. OAS728]MBE1529261.1 uncharacterized membrane protein YhaH (DUF805 family) [Sphingopyxis sp. OAS728]